MCLINNNRKPLLGERNQIFNNVRELLHSANHNFFTVQQSCLQIPGCAVDIFQHTSRLDKLRKRTLKHTINYPPVRQHKHGIKDRLIICVMQHGKSGGQCSDLYRFSAPGAVLVQIGMSRSIFLSMSAQLAYSLQLMIARKNLRLLPGAPPIFIVHINDLNKALNQIQHTSLCPNLFPKIRSGDSSPAWRVARPSVAPPIKREKLCPASSQSGGHIYLIRIHCKMSQTAGKLKQRLLRTPGVAILGHSIQHILTTQLIFQLTGKHREPVNKQTEVYALFRVQRILETARRGFIVKNVEKISFIQLLKVRIQPAGRLKKTELEMVPTFIQPLAEQMQGSVAFHNLFCAACNTGRGVRAMNRRVRLPFFRLRNLKETNKRLGQHAELPVVLIRHRSKKSVRFY